MISFNEFSSIPFVNELLSKSYDEGGLDIYEQGIYIYALKVQDDTKHLFSIDRICKALGIGKLLCRRAVKSLEARNLLKREFYHDEKGYKRAFYRVICDGDNPFEPLDFEDDEEMIIVSQYTKSPLELFKQQNKSEVSIDSSEKEIEVEIKAYRDYQKHNGRDYTQFADMKIESNESVDLTRHIKQEVKQEHKSFADLMAEQIEEKALLIYKKFCKNESLDYECWLEWARYKQSIGNVNIASLEIVLKQNMNILNTFGDKANKSIENSIGSGYKALFIPNEPKQNFSNTNNANSGEVKENSITKAGINIPIKWDLLTPSIYYDLDYSKEFWHIVKCFKEDDLQKYLIIDGRDKEVREFLNQCIELRLAFLAKYKNAKKESESEEYISSDSGDIWGNAKW